MIKHIVVFLIAVAGSRAEIEFTGFLISPKGALYSLGDTESRASSGWLKIGQSFRGYTVEAFDREHEVITLRRLDQVLTVRLRDSKVKNGKETISGSITVGSERLDGIHASLFLGEEMAFPIKDGMTFYLKAERLADGNLKFSARFVATGKDGKEEILASPVLIALPGRPFGMKVGEFGYSFKP